MSKWGLTWDLHCTSIISPLYLYKLVPKISKDHLFTKSRATKSALWLPKLVAPRLPQRPPCETYMTTQSMYKYVNLSTCQSIYDNISIYKSINQYINLTINLCINISTYQPIYENISTYKSINQYINLTINLCISISTYQPVNSYISLSLSIYLTIYLSICLYIYLSIYLYI